jgi:hypothetical protein
MSRELVPFLIGELKEARISEVVTNAGSGGGFDFEATADMRERDAVLLGRERLPARHPFGMSTDTVPPPG